MPAPAPSRSVLSLRQASFAEHGQSSVPALLELELLRGETVLIEVADEEAAAALVDLCLGLADPAAGEVSFLGVEWRTLAVRQRLNSRQRIGIVGETRVWPAHLSVAEGILLPRLLRMSSTRDEVIADATTLARHFGLPGLPTDRRDTTSRRTLVRAACVRGFLGTPELIVIQDAALDEAADLATPLAQAIALVRERGGTTLWITENLGSLGARFVQADRVFRLGDRGLLVVRRPS
jgi:phospholipid/cholesterol/gamma-HCH transport system ATP-binding protein